MDETLIHVAEVCRGLRADGVMAINSARPEEELREELREKLREEKGELKGELKEKFREDANFPGLKNLAVLDATAIALDILKSPIVNTVMLGAVVTVTDIVDAADVEKAIEELMPKHLAASNKLAFRTACGTAGERRRL